LISVLIFTVQVLTLLFGIVYIFVSRRALSIALVLLYSLVIALMIYTSITVPVPLYTVGDYEQGSYLTFGSLAMFLLGFIQYERTKKQQMSKSYLQKRSSPNNVVSRSLAKSVHDGKA
jgi:hypothetical protein